MTKQENGWIAPYPYSSNIEVVDGEWQPRLSILSRMSADAAVAAWRENPDLKIVLAGETLYGRHLPNTSDLMADRIKSQGDIPVVGLPHLPNGDPLNNTYLQTAALRLFADQQSSAMDTLALYYHSPRVIKAGRAYGLSAEHHTAEDILAEAGIDDYDRYQPAIDGLRRSEKIIRLINRIDRKGGLFNFLSLRNGGRLVDVEVVDGQLELVQTEARKKVAQLAIEHGIDPIKY